MESTPTEKFIFSMSHLSLAHYTVTLILAQRKGKKQGQKSAACTNTAARKKFTASVLDVMQKPWTQKPVCFLPSY